MTEYKYQCNECYSDCNKNSEEGCFTNEPSDLLPTSCIELEWDYKPKWKEVEVKNLEEVYQEHADVWDEGEEERTCSNCSNVTNIYECFIYKDNYYCSECCPLEWGE